MTREILRHFESYGFLNLGDFAMRQRDECHRRAQDSCTRDKGDNCATIRANNKSSEQWLLLKQNTDTYKDLHDDTLSATHAIPRFVGTPHASALCVLGESIFAVILDHEVRAAKLTNRLISGCQWRRDALSDEHLVGTKFVRRERNVARSGILMRKWTLGCQYRWNQQDRRQFQQQYFRLHFCLDTTADNSRCVDKACTRKH